MEQVFDIFSRLPDGTPMWLESVEGFDEAKNRVKILARFRPGKYFIYSEQRAGVVGRVSESDDEPADRINTPPRVVRRAPC
jgi:hypothetical protein